MPEYVVNFAATQIADDEGRLDAPSFHRNHEAIWSVLGRFLSSRSGNALEVGSGTGQHAMELARRAPEIRWQPSDVAVEHLRSIEGWRTTSGLTNVRAPIVVDLSIADWPSRVVPSLIAIVCINVLHISPWRISENLLVGAPRILCSEGRLFIYGAFKRGGAHTAPSNVDFDASLRAGNPEWGLRDIDDLDALATRSGLVLAEVVAMPANNFVLAFARRG